MKSACLEVKMKATVLFILFSLLAVGCFGVFQFGIGIDAMGNHAYDFSSQSLLNDADYDVSLGISPAIEYLVPVNSFLLGLGAEYQVQRMVDFPPEGLDGKMGFIPLFCIIRYQLASQRKFFPELVGQIGYNFMTADEDYLEGDAEVSGGLYWGIGAGINISKIYLIQMMYKNNYGSYDREIDNLKADISNSQLNLSLNMRF